MELCDHVQQLHTDIVRQSATLTPTAKGGEEGGLQCPLCQSKCGSDRAQLESHLLQVSIATFLSVCFGRPSTLSLSLSRTPTYEQRMYRLPVVGTLYAPF